MQDKTPFWKRKPSIVKCHMLILAHLARADIPKSLRADYSAVMKKCPLFLEEIINIANFPRPPAVSAPLPHAPWHKRFQAALCPLAAKHVRLCCAGSQCLSYIATQGPGLCAPATEHCQ